MKVVVNISGGTVCNILADSEDIKVLIVDFDSDGQEDLATDQDIDDFMEDGDFGPVSHVKKIL